MIPIFTGYDEREADGWDVFTKSVLKHSSQLVSFTPLNAEMAGIRRVGTNAFTYARYLIPEILGYRGKAMFVDGADMLVRADISQLWKLFDPLYAVQIVPHNYSTTQDRKYIGTPMEAPNVDYPRKNWSSVMLINASHRAWRAITQSTVDSMVAADLHRFAFIPNRYIGYLPVEWNWLVGEYPRIEEAKLVHFTLGIPSMPYYSKCDYADEWKAYGA